MSLHSKRPFWKYGLAGLAVVSGAALSQLYPNAKEFRLSSDSRSGDRGDFDAEREAPRPPPTREGRLDAQAAVDNSLREVFLHASNTNKIPDDETLFASKELDDVGNKEVLLQRDGDTVLIPRELLDGSPAILWGKYTLPSAVHSESTASLPVELGAAIRLATHVNPRLVYWCRKDGQRHKLRRPAIDGSIFFERIPVSPIPGADDVLFLGVEGMNVTFPVGGLKPGEERACSLDGRLVGLDGEVMCSGQPVPCVTVQARLVGSHKTRVFTTGGFGVFWATGLDSGVYEFKAIAAPGIESAVVTKEVTRSGPAVHPVLLIDAPSISGTVEWPDGRPVEHFSVRAMEADGSTTVVQGALGRFAVVGIQFARTLRIESKPPALPGYAYLEQVASGPLAPISLSEAFEVKVALSDACPMCLMDANLYASESDQGFSIRRSVNASDSLALWLPRGFWRFALVNRGGKIGSAISSVPGDPVALSVQCKH